MVVKVPLKVSDVSAQQTSKGLKKRGRGRPKKDGLVRKLDISPRKFSRKIYSKTPKLAQQQNKDILKEETKAKRSEELHTKPDFNSSNLNANLDINKTKKIDRITVNLNSKAPSSALVISL